VIALLAVGMNAGIGHEWQYVFNPKDMQDIAQAAIAKYPNNTKVNNFESLGSYF
jgi:hypothetical protein